MSTVSWLACVASASLRFRSKVKERGKRVKNRAKMARVKERGGAGEERFHFSRGQNRKSRSSIFPSPLRNQTETLVTQAISWSRILTSSQLISWLALDWCSQTAGFFLAFAQSLLQSPSCPSYVVLSTAVACNVVHHAHFLLRRSLFFWTYQLGP